MTHLCFLSVLCLNPRKVAAFCRHKNLRQEYPRPSKSHLVWITPSWFGCLFLCNLRDARGSRWLSQQQLLQRWNKPFLAEFVLEKNGSGAFCRLLCRCFFAWRDVSMMFEICGCLRVKQLCGTLCKEPRVKLIKALTQGALRNCYLHPGLASLHKKT